MDNNMDNQQEKIVRTLLMRITPHPAIYFDVNVTEHRNLNCKCCSSFAPPFETKKLTAIINKLKEVHTSDNENK